MTVSEGLVVFCNGRRGKCPARFETSEGYQLGALYQAHARGWDVSYDDASPDRALGALHYCPNCRRPAGAGLDILTPEPETPNALAEVDTSGMVIDQEVAAAYEQLERQLAGAAHTHGPECLLRTRMGWPGCVVSEQYAYQHSGNPEDWRWGP